MKGYRADGSRFDWPEPRVWKQSEENLARVGITYAQIDEDTYAENFWAPEGTQYNVLMEALGETHYYDALLDLHQTYEQEEHYDTFVQYADADWMPQAQQEYAIAWGKAVQGTLKRLVPTSAGFIQVAMNAGLSTNFLLNTALPICSLKFRITTPIHRWMSNSFTQKP